VRREAPVAETGPAAPAPLLSPDRQRALCLAIVGGSTLAEACASPPAIAEDGVRTLLAGDPVFARRLAAARLLRAESLCEEVLALLRDLEAGPLPDEGGERLALERAKLGLSARRWLVDRQMGRGESTIAAWAAALGDSEETGGLDLSGLDEEERAAWRRLTAKLLRRRNLPGT